MFSIIGAEILGEALPGVVNFDEMGDVADVDLVVCALGYEERTNSALTALAKYGIPVSQALIWNYAGQVSQNEENRSGMIELLDILGAAWSDISSPRELESGLRNLVTQMPEDAIAHVVVDLSVMSGSVVLASIAALREMGEAPRLRLTFMYSEALKYGPSEAEFRTSQAEFEAAGSLGLDEGILSVSSGVSMRGTHDPGLRDLLIVIPGFSRDRVRAAISFLNPALLLSGDEHILWTVGTPHLAEDGWRQEAMRRLHNIPDEGAEALSTFDYAETYRLLERTYESEWLTSNLNVLFFGSKLQALALGLFSAVRGGVRVVFSTPLTYRAVDYTKGTRDVWAVEFPDWHSTLKRLATVGTVSLVD